jgi:mono/diheme cytochrome c family protein
MRTRKLDHEGVFAWIMPVVVAGLLAACGGGDGGAGGGAGETAGGTGAGTPAGGAGAEAPAGGAGAEAPPPAAGDTAPAGGAGGDAAAGGGGASALVALGDSVFHGQVGGGTCYVCHGQDGKGSGVGPNLTDAEWLNTDGTLAGITKTVQSGVPTPKKAPAPMPPMGGASLSPDQVKAVAAYVHTLGGGK